MTGIQLRRALDLFVWEPRKLEVDFIVEHATPDATPGLPDFSEFRVGRVVVRGNYEIEGVSELVGAFARGCNGVRVLARQKTTVQSGLLLVRTASTGDSGHESCSPRDIHQLTSKRPKSRNQAKKRGSHPSRPF
jgi:hypothetical protein